MTVSSESVVSPESSGDYQDDSQSRLTVQITAVANGTGKLTGFNVYSWTEQQFYCNSNPVKYKNGDSARTGTATRALAIEKNNQLLTPPFFADLRPIGALNGSPIYEFSAGGAATALADILVGSNGVVPGAINTAALSGTPNANGYYNGTITTPAGTVNVRIKNVNGKPLAANCYVLGSPNGIDPTDNTTPAYLTDVGGVTGTWTYYSSVMCPSGLSVVTWTDTYLNGALVSRV